MLTWQYADVGLHASRHLPGAPAAAVFNPVISEATAGLLGLALLLFPDGRLPSRRWRPALASLLAGIVLLVLAGTLRPGPYAEPFAAVSNPFGLGGRAPRMDAVDFAGWLFVVAGIGAGAAAMVVRLRRARGVERQQLKLVLAVGAVAATVAALVMATWLVWPTGHLQARIAVLGVCFARRSRSLPGWRSCATASTRSTSSSTARSSTRRSRVILAAAFAATTCCSGRRSAAARRGRPRRRRSLVAVAFRPLRARVQDAVDRRFNRARYDALRRMADFLEDLRAGRAAPEEVEGVLREVLADPRLELRFFLPESELLRRRPRAARRATPRRRAGADPDRARRAAARAWCSTTPRRGERPRACCAGRRGRRPGDRDRAAAGGAAPPARRGRGLPGADRRPPANEERRRIERDLHDGAQQRLVSIGLALRHAQHELGRLRRERAGTTLDGAVAEIAIAIDELRELAHGLPPGQLDAGTRPGAPRARPPRARAGRGRRRPRERFDRGVEAAAYFIACEGLTNAVKHAHATQDRARARRARTASSSSRSPTTASAAPRRPRAPACAGLADRVAAYGGTLRIDSAPGAGTDADRGAAVRVVIAEDQVLLREGLGAAVRGRRPRGRRVARRRRRAARRGRRARPRPRRPRHPDAADVHRRGRARGAERSSRRTPSSACSCSPSTSRPRHAVELVALGGFGYLLKDRVLDVGEFLAAAERVADGGSALDPQVVASLVVARGDGDPLAELTEREREVLELMAEGLTNAGIAKRLVPQRAHGRGARAPRAHEARHPRGEDAHRRVLAVLACLGATQPR